MSLSNMLTRKMSVKYQTAALGSTTGTASIITFNVPGNQYY